MYVRTYVRTCMHAYVRTYVHTYMYTCIHTIWKYYDLYNELLFVWQLNAKLVSIHSLDEHIAVMKMLSSVALSQKKHMWIGLLEDAEGNYN